MRSAIASLLLLSAAAHAGDPGTLHRAVDAFDAGNHRAAAIGFHQVAEGSAPADQRETAEYDLAQSLDRMGLDFSAFYYYGQIVQAGPRHRFYLQAVQGAVAVIERTGDEVVGPSVLDKGYSEEVGKLPPGIRSKLDYALALLGYRAGRYADAGKFLQGVTPQSPGYAQAQYLAGLLAQRTDPENALRTFRGILALDGGGYGDLKELKELTHLALGRTLFGLRRYAEASAEYAALPRFSRHWDEALFEGAYADLQNDDPGAALGKLHSLHSPHLSDEFAPESQNLTAVIYHQHCLWPQVRAVLDRFQREYVPMRDQVKAFLERDPPAEELVASLETAGKIPAPVQRHLRKNERIESMLAYLQRLDAEARAIRGDGELMGSPLGPDLQDLIGRQRALALQLTGKFVRGRMADVAHLIDVLDGEKEIIGFETTKGEKQFLEENVDVKGRLAAQKLQRPAMPASGHEYWPFDGEYWPDEIGYYRYTIKDACPSGRKED